MISKNSPINNCSGLYITYMEEANEIIRICFTQLVIPNA